MLQYDLSVAKRKTYMFEQTNANLNIVLNLPIHSRLQLFVHLPIHRLL
jgi:hypothetical protein